ncbi:oligosaccharide flippase family protein [Corynebacterium callunae]|uniref:oligosaccharide flippase family protein n=1 Tax=Corynebacterium callunae TaxID=1721 RepID=UPI001FFE820B|nr:oligosaccharide flippase family protein [Corynebacterium callunae]
MRFNTVLVALSQLVISLAPLMVMPFLTRTIEADGLGIYSLSFSVAAVCLAFGQMGSQLYGRREIAATSNRSERTRVFWELASLVFRATLLVSLIYVGVSFFIVDRSSILFSALLIQLLYLLSGALDVSWLLHGVERFRIVAGAIVLSRIVNVAWIFLAIRDPEDALLYVLIMATTFLIASLLPWLVVYKFVDRPAFSSLFSLKHLRPLRHFVVPAVALQLFGAVNITIIGFYMTSAEVGYYDLAFRLARSPITLITVVGVVLLPKVTALFVSGDTESIGVYLHRGMNVTLILASLIGFGFIGTANTFVTIFAGEKFESSVILLQILALSLLTIAWGNVLRTQIILPQGLDRLYSYSLLIGLLVSIITSFLLLRPLGMVGAAIGFVFGELVVCVIQTIFIKELLDLKDLSLLAIRIVLCGIISCLGMLLVSEIEIGLYLTFSLQVLIGTLVFFILVSVSELMTKDYFILNELSRVKRNRFSR